MQRASPKNYVWVISAQSAPNQPMRPVYLHREQGPSHFMARAQIIGNPRFKPTEFPDFDSAQRMVNQLVLATGWKCSVRSVERENPHALGSPLSAAELARTAGPDAVPMVPARAGGAA